MNQPPSPWKKSRAKAHLRSLLQDPSSWVHILSEEQVHASDDLFKKYPLRNFKVNFNTLKKAVELEQGAIQFDKLALEADNERHPRKTLTERGYNYWDRHPAQRLLADDVKAGITTHLKPTELQKTRPEFQEFPLAVFRGHKYQEERKMREGVYWQKKRNDKARKDHEHQVQNQRARDA